MVKKSNGANCVYMDEHGNELYEGFHKVRKVIEYFAKDKNGKNLDIKYVKILVKNAGIKFK